jgi:hypothetical protein
MMCRTNDAFQWFREHQEQEPGSVTPLPSALSSPTPENLPSHSLTEGHPNATTAFHSSGINGIWKCPLKSENGRVCGHEITGAEKGTVGEHFESHLRSIGLSVRNGVSRFSKTFLHTYCISRN